MTGIDPAGCYVHSFKQPREDELEHDFLWRTTLRLPSKGMIGIFNRSYYEEVLVVRVHPEYLKAQRLPEAKATDKFWEQRLESIRDHERHLARNGTVILKFWLNVSPKSSASVSSAVWKKRTSIGNSMSGTVESQHWDEYMQAYERTLNATSKPWAPWYAIPADDKPYMRVCVAEIIVDTLKRMNLDYPELDAETRKRFKMLEKQLREEK